MAELSPYYQRNGITIYNNDCLEVMPRLDVVFDAIIADLPYGQTACNWDMVIPFEPLWAEYKRLIKERGAVVLFGSQPFTTDLIMSNRSWFKYEWIWIKDQISNPYLAKIMPLKNIENILVFCAFSTIYNPQDIKSTNKNRSPDAPSERLRRLDQSKRYTQKITNYPKMAIQFDCDRGLHPTQKPVSLLQYLIRTYTNPSEIILDNTMGSGTTLVAAQNEGRRAIGIESDETFCKIAIDRLRQPSFFSIPDKPKTPNSKQLELII